MFFLLNFLFSVLLAKLDCVCLLLIAFRAAFISGMGALIMAALANACRPPLFR